MAAESHKPKHKRTGPAQGGFPYDTGEAAYDYEGLPENVAYTPPKPKPKSKPKPPSRAGSAPPSRAESAALAQQAADAAQQVGELVLGPDADALPEIIVPGDAIDRRLEAARRAALWRQSQGRADYVEDFGQAEESGIFEERPEAPPKSGQLMLQEASARADFGEASEGAIRYNIEHGQPAPIPTLEELEPKRQEADGALRQAITILDALSQERNARAERYQEDMDAAQDYELKRQIYNEWTAYHTKAETEYDRLYKQAIAAADAAQSVHVQQQEAWTRAVYGTPIEERYQRALGQYYTPWDRASDYATNMEAFRRAERRYETWLQARREWAAAFDAYDTANPAYQQAQDRALQARQEWAAAFDAWDTANVDYQRAQDRARQARQEGAAAFDAYDTADPDYRRAERSLLHPDRDLTHEAAASATALGQAVAQEDQDRSGLFGLAREGLEAGLVRAGEQIAIPHNVAWNVHDIIRHSDDPLGDLYRGIDDRTLDDASQDRPAIQRSFDFFPEIDLGRFTNPAYLPFGGGLAAQQLGFDRQLAPEGLLAVNPLSFVPGQDIARAAQDRRIEGGEWLDVGFSLADFVPVGAVAKAPFTAARGAVRTVAPRALGGGFLGATSPWAHVPTLRGGMFDKELLDASIAARRQLAETGSARVVIGGNTYVVPQTALDRAIRQANPGATLSATASPDVRPFLEGGTIPTLRYPSGAIKPPSHQGQFRTLGAGGVLHLADRSALGFTPPPGGLPGLGVYSDPYKSLVVPGSPGDPLGVLWYHGRELEALKPTGTRGQPLRDVGAIGPGRTRLYLAEDLVEPSYSQRVGANLRALGQKVTGGAGVRKATREEIARARFDTGVEDLTPTQARYVDLARSSDRQLVRLTDLGNADAAALLTQRQRLSGALDDLSPLDLDADFALMEKLLPPSSPTGRPRARTSASGARRSRPGNVLIDSPGPRIRRPPDGPPRRPPDGPPRRPPDGPPRRPPDGPPRRPPDGPPRRPPDGPPRRPPDGPPRRPPDGPPRRPPDGPPRRPPDGPPRRPPDGPPRRPPDGPPRRPPDGPPRRPPDGPPRRPPDGPPRRPPDGPPRRPPDGPPRRPPDGPPRRPPDGPPRRPPDGPPRRPPDGPPRRPPDGPPRRPPDGPPRRPPDGPPRRPPDGPLFPELVRVTVQGVEHTINLVSGERVSRPSRFYNTALEILTKSPASPRVTEFKTKRGRLTVAPHGVYFTPKPRRKRRRRPRNPDDFIIR